MLIKLLILLFVSTNVWSADPPPTLYDEGTKQGVIFNFNCTGDGITCSRSGITGTLNVAASGSGGVGVGTVSPGVINRIAYYPGTTNVTLDDLAALTTDGTNIGIGTTGPRQKLEVTGNTILIGNTGINTINTSSILSVNGNIGLGSTFVGIGTSNPRITSIVDINGMTSPSDVQGRNIYLTAGNAGIGTFNPGGSILINAGTRTGSIHNNGVICIGCTEAQLASLTWAGQNLLYSTGTGYFANYISQSGGSYNWGTSSTLISGLGTSATSDSITFRTNSTDRVRIDGFDGRVGIGTLVMTSRLNVNGGVGIGTGVTSSFLRTAAPGGGVIIENNVGIGTFEPANKLEVVGTVQTDGFKLDTNPSAGYVLVSGSTGIGTWMSPSSIGAGSVGSSSQWFTTSGIGIGTYDMVGIGTTGVSTVALQVVKTAAGTESTPLVIQNSDATTGTAVRTIMGATTSISANTNGRVDQLAVRDSNGAMDYSIISSPGGAATPTNKFTILGAGGNVGIGSVNPIQDLDVAGTIRATTDILVGAQSVCQEDGTNCPASAPAAPAGGTGAVQYNNAGTTAGAEAVFSFNGTNIGLGTTNGTQLLDVRGVAYIQGNVGIGTLAPANAPQARLHIVQGANAPALIVDDVDGNDSSPALYINSSGAVGFGTTNPTSRIHMNTSGAGMTLQSPDDSLEVRFSVDSDNNQTNDYNLIEFRRNADPSVSWVIGQNGANSGNFNIRYGGSDMSGGSAAFVINSSGNVGMGLTNQNPAAILDISTTANQNLFVVEDNGDADTTPFLIDATGNVGIGTTSTQTKVAILGGNVGIGTWTATNASLETTGLRVFNQGEAAGRVLVSNSLGIGTWMTASSIGAGGSGTNYWSLSAGTGNVGINTTQSVGIGTTMSNNGALVILPVQSGAGNVGIGTWNPTGSLEVKGSGVNTFSTNVGIGTTVGVPNALYVVGTPMFTAGLNIGIGTASPTRLCIANGAIAVCP